VVFIVVVGVVTTDTVGETVLAGEAMVVVNDADGFAAELHAENDMPRQMEAAPNPVALKSCIRTR
jgi:hypothetical protein